MNYIIFLSITLSTTLLLNTEGFKILSHSAVQRVRCSLSMSTSLSFSGGKHLSSLVLDTSSQVGMVRIAVCSPVSLYSPTPQMVDLFSFSAYCLLDRRVLGIMTWKFKSFYCNVEMWSDPEKFGWKFRKYFENLCGKYEFKRSQSK